MSLKRFSRDATSPQLSPMNESRKPNMSDSHQVSVESDTSASSRSENPGILSSSDVDDRKNYTMGNEFLRVPNERKKRPLSERMQCYGRKFIKDKNTGDDPNKVCVPNNKHDLTKSPVSRQLSNALNSLDHDSSLATRKVPDALQDFLWKNRRFPLNGWHKRFFLLKNGVLIYGKTQNSVNKGHYTAQIDLATTYVTFEASRLMIDIDATVIIYHIKFDDSSTFLQWLQAIKEHRLYNQFYMTTENRKNKDSSQNPTFAPLNLQSNTGSVDSLSGISINIDDSDTSIVQALRPQKSDAAESPPVNAPSMSGITARKNFIISKEKWVHSSAIEQLMSTMKLLVTGYHQLKCVQENFESFSRPEVEEEKGPSRSLFFSPVPFPEQDGSDMMTPKSSSIVDPFLHHRDISCGSSVISTHTAIQSPVHEISSPTAHGTRDRFQTPLNFQSEKFEQLLTDANSATLYLCTKAKHFLNEANDVIELLDKSFNENDRKNNQNQSSTLTADGKNKNNLNRNEIEIEDIETSERIDSETESQSDHNELSDESSHEPVPSSDFLLQFSDMKTFTRSPESVLGRRKTLPVNQPDISSFSLLSLLRSNIGRELTRVRLPVILNEPLSALQHLCEDMEYSHLLDDAVKLDDKYQRMLYVASFAISGYAKTVKRAATKPFNPILGETFECVRPEKNWRFLAEQVSHYPPVAVANCTSPNWVFDQEMSIKNKFWGKSLEIKPIGGCKLYIPRWKETYSWNKVTSCVTGLFSISSRSLEHYGDIFFVCSNGVTCNVKFLKPNGSNTSEGRVVSGVVHASNGDKDNKWTLFGKWDEIIVCRDANLETKCIWRPTPLPPSASYNYGFTTFAIELNEPPDANAVASGHLPITDCRLRPDQRFLEVGRVEEAEVEKSRLEDEQRRRLKLLKSKQGSNEVDANSNWKSIWFSPKAKPEVIDPGLKFMYTFNETYWRIRDAKGFKGLKLPQLW